MKQLKMSSHFKLNTIFNNIHYYSKIERIEKHMEVKTIQEFLGTINGVEFKSYKLFMSMEYILGRIQSEFGTSEDIDVFTPEFIEDFSDAIEDAYFGSELSYENIEEELETCIEEADSFEDIHFEIYGLESDFEYINEVFETNPSKYVVQ